MAKGSDTLETFGVMEIIENFETQQYLRDVYSTLLVFALRLIKVGNLIWLRPNVWFRGHLHIVARILIAQI